MDTEVVRIRGACIGDGGYGSIKGLNLLVGKGELVNIIGITGAGKTTLGDYFRGEEILHGGSVSFCGKKMSVGEKFAGTKDVICIGEVSTLLPELSIAENIGIITRRRKIRGIINKKSLNKRTDFLLSDAAPELSAEMKAKELTRVEKHIIEILRAVENEAKLIYIDIAFELYGQVDMLRMSQIISALLKRGVTIIYASRRMDAISYLSKRIVVLRKGRDVKTFYNESFSQRSLIDWISGNKREKQPHKVSHKTSQVIFKAIGLGDGGTLCGLDFSICQGEIVGFYDLNYENNLTALSILAGINRAAEGSMVLDGKKYAPSSLEEAIKQRVGYVHSLQHRSKLIDNMTFSENLALPVMQKMSTFSLFNNRRLDGFLEKEYRKVLGIKEEDVRKPISHFDIYVRMNILLYKWQLVKPQILLCEEICEETDLRMQSLVYERLIQIAKEKTAIIIASQNIKELEEICDTIYVMNSYGQNGEKSEAITKIKVGGEFLE